MPYTFEPGKLVIAQEARASEPYGDTPLGVEAAWCPGGTGVPCAAAAYEASMRPMESWTLLSPYPSSY